MTNKEKAALLAAGEESLSFYEKGLDVNLQKENYPLAWDYRCMYEGAAYMLKSLGLISIEDYHARSETAFDRYLNARYPEHVFEEATGT